MLAIVVLIPLRRAERWAFWMCLLPLATYGVPVLLIDATHVEWDRLGATLPLQLAGRSSSFFAS